MPRVDGSPTNTELRRYLRQWENGRSKIDIEQAELGTNGRGKTISRLWTDRLEVDTYGRQVLG